MKRCYNVQDEISNMKIFFNKDFHKKSELDKMILIQEIRDWCYDNIPIQFGWYLMYDGYWPTAIWLPKTDAILFKLKFQI